MPISPNYVKILEGNKWSLKRIRQVFSQPSGLQEAHIEGG